MGCVVILTMTKTFTFVGGQVVVHEKYFKDNVSPLIFTSLEACIMICCEEIHAKLHPICNHNRENFYILDKSLSSTSYSFLG